MENIKNILTKEKKSCLLILISLSLGLILGASIYKAGFISSNGCSAFDFKFINPDMACKEKLVIRKSAYVQLKSDLLDFIEVSKKQGSVESVSIYFRDLQNGPTLGINEHTLFSPASLLKLPLLLTYVNLKNHIDGLMERTIEFDAIAIDVPQNIAPKDSISHGKMYRIEELLEYMIKYSDNKSYYLLLDYLREISPNKDLLKETYVDLGILDPQNFLEDTISVKAYGSILVQLYHSSFFNKKEDSDYVLEKLAQVDWKYGLDAGLPLGTVVAHKFGERTGFASGLKQLHDCGIIYFKDNPYMLCVMTRGHDLEKLADFIANISAMFYKEIESRKL